MHAIEISLYALAVGFCLYSLWWVRHSFVEYSLFYLKLFLGFKALQFALHWLTLHPDTLYKPAILGALMAFTFLLAPCLWLFAKESVEGRKPSLKTLNVADWGVILLGVLLTIPLIEVAKASQHMIAPEGPSSIEKSIWVHGTMLLCIGLYLYQVPRYLIACISIIKKQVKRNELLFSNIDDMPLQSLRALIWVMLANWLLIFLRTLGTVVSDNTSLFDFAIIALDVGTTVWMLAETLKRCNTKNLSNQSLIQELTTELDQPKSESKSIKYKNSSIDNAVRNRIESKIQTLMINEKIYKQSNLKLIDLCSATGEKTHYVSQVVNETLNTNFYELVNHYRIEAAKLALIDRPDDTILDIALEVGFNSKSTFNSAFKRNCGKTPSQFRAEHKTI